MRKLHLRTVSSCAGPARRAICHRPQGMSRTNAFRERTFGPIATIIGLGAGGAVPCGGGRRSCAQSPHSAVFARGLHYRGWLQVDGEDECSSLKEHNCTKSFSSTLYAFVYSLPTLITTVPKLPWHWRVLPFFDSAMIQHPLNRAYRSLSIPASTLPFHATFRQPRMVHRVYGPMGRQETSERR